MRRLVEVIDSKNEEKLRDVVAPVIEKCLEEDQAECVEDAIGCLTALVCAKPPDGKPMDTQMWRLFKKMILAVGGTNAEQDLGFAAECLPLATKTIQHFI